MCSGFTLYDRIARAGNWRPVSPRFDRHKSVIGRNYLAKAVAASISRLSRESWCAPATQPHICASPSCKLIRIENSAAPCSPTAFKRLKLLQRQQPESAHTYLKMCIKRSQCEQVGDTARNEDAKSSEPTIASTKEVQAKKRAVWKRSASKNARKVNANIQLDSEEKDQRR